MNVEKAKDHLTTAREHPMNPRARDEIDRAMEALSDQSMTLQCSCGWDGTHDDQDALGSKEGCCPRCGNEKLSEQPEPAEEIKIIIEHHGKEIMNLNDQCVKIRKALEDKIKNLKALLMEIAERLYQKSQGSCVICGEEDYPIKGDLKGYDVVTPDGADDWQIDHAPECLTLKIDQALKD